MIAGLLLLIGTAPETRQEPPIKLPIDLPKDASVNFEAEGAGKQILTSVKHMLAGNMTDPTAPPADKLSVKTPMGNVDIKIDDLAPLIEKIHALHVVSYTAIPNVDPFKFHERQFAADGLKRVAFTPGANGVLIMRQSAKTDRFGIVMRQKDSVLVLRSDGAPGLGDIAKALFEALSRAVQQAVNTKHQTATGSQPFSIAQSPFRAPGTSFQSGLR